jgi:hypothetical protein
VLSRLIVRPGDARTIYAPVSEHARWVESRLVRDDDGEIVGVQPAAFPLDPQTMIEALHLLVDRLRAQTPHMAAHRLDDLAWGAADLLIGRVDDYMQDASLSTIAELVVAQGELQRELVRLRVMRVVDPETGRLVARAFGAAA